MALADFLSSYRGREAQMNAQPMQELQQVGALQGILAKVQAAQEAQTSKELLTRIGQETGGDPAKMVPALLKAGPIGIKLAEGMKGLLPKPAEDRVVAPGGALVRPDGTVRSQAPFKPDKPHKPPEIVQMTELYASLPEGDPRKAILKKAIEAKTFGREEAIRLAASLRQPAAEQPPVAVIGPDNKPVFVNRADAIGKQPAVKETADRVIPANIAKAYQENSTALRKIDTALSEVDKYPAAFGLQNVRGDAISQRVDPKGVTARAIVADIGSLKIHDRSGAAVSVSEFPRLAPFIPQEYDTFEKVMGNLDAMERELTIVLKALASGVLLKDLLVGGDGGMGDASQQPPAGPANLTPFLPPRRP